MPLPHRAAGQRRREQHGAALVAADAADRAGEMPVEIREHAARAQQIERALIAAPPTRRRGLTGQRVRQLLDQRRRRRRSRTTPVAGPCAGAMPRTNR